MNSTKRYGVTTALLSVIFVSLILTLSPQCAWAQDDKKKDEAPPQGTPVFWREPADITTLDLLAGPGGDSKKPDLSQVIWEEQASESGYSVKWRVRDASGKKWVVKLGNEARPETAATRLVWAAGYPTEVNYLVPCVKITNAPKPPKDKSVKRCEKDGFADVRFEARPDDVKRLDLWSWKQNPFAGTREFNGLLVIMALVNNWDLKDDNNKVIYHPGEGGGELRYVISDLGATFGKTGGPITHSRNEPEKYIKTGFVEKVEGNLVRFDYHGKNSGLFENISTADAKWIGDLLSRLSERQIMDAFRAANFDADEIEGLTYEVRARINALHNLPGGGEAAQPAATASPAPGR